MQEHIGFNWLIVVFNESIKEKREMQNYYYIGILFLLTYVFIPLSAAYLPSAILNQ